MFGGGTQRERERGGKKRGKEQRKTEQKNLKNKMKSKDKAILPIYSHLWLFFWCKHSMHIKIMYIYKMQAAKFFFL